MLKGVIRRGSKIKEFSGWLGNQLSSIPAPAKFYEHVNLMKNAIEFQNVKKLDLRGKLKGCKDETAALRTLAKLVNATGVKEVIFDKSLSAEAFTSYFDVIKNEPSLSKKKKSISTTFSELNISDDKPEEPKKNNAKKSNRTI